MYAMRADSSQDLPGRPVARLASEHPAMDRGGDVQVFDEVGTGWVDDLDLSLDPIELAPATATGNRQARVRRGRSPLLVAAIGLALLALLGVGVIGAVVLGGAVAAAVVLLVVGRTAPAPELPVALDPTPIEVVAPIEAEARRPVVETPAAKAPARRPRPSGEDAPAPGGVDAEMVIMPDPGFKTVPVDKAIRKLHDRAGNGEIGAVQGR